jgi:ribosomal subunit interface protein
MMQILVHTDNHIEGGESLTAHVESVVADAMERFGNRVTRVEVQLTDENSNKKGGDKDKRCAMEARLAGLSPIAVSDLAPTLHQAIDGALEKLEKSLDRTLAKRDDPKGRPSMSGE